MQLTVCILVLLAAIALVKSEECQGVGDCNHVTCPEANYVKDCHNRQCTCTHTGTNGGCSAVSDCADPNCHRDQHCVDERCRCGFGFGGGPGGK